MFYNYNKEYDLVVGYNYGGEGIMPCNKNSEWSCVGRSGDSFCGGYRGCEEIILNKKVLYIVQCDNEIECAKE